MFGLVKALLLHILFLAICQSAPQHSIQINEPQTFEPRTTPINSHAARNALGYDHFQRLPTDPKKETKKYDWEKFDTPEIKYNF